MEAYVLITTDSRGRGLDSNLRQGGTLPDKTIIDSHSKGGATLEDLFKDLRRTTREAVRKHPGHKVVIILSGGICNLTTKSGGRHDTQVHYNHDESSLGNIRKTLDEIWAYSNERGYYLIVTSILPVSLKISTEFQIKTGRLRTSRYTEEELAEQQGALDQDILDLNNHIAQKCKRENAVFVNLSNDLQTISTKTLGKRKKYKKKITKIHYEKLFDGVHPDDELKANLFARISKACRYLLIPPPKEAGNSTEDTQSEPETWDHKRRKTTKT